MKWQVYPPGFFSRYFWWYSSARVDGPASTISVTIGLLPLARLVDPGLHRLGDLPLLGGGHEDRRAVLRADVVPLAVARGRVVHAEEPLLEQVGVRQLLRIEHDAHRLGVAGRARVHVLVGRVRASCRPCRPPRSRARPGSCAGSPPSPRSSRRRGSRSRASARSRACRPARGARSCCRRTRPACVAALGPLEERRVLAVALGRELVDRDEAQRRRVDAVARVRRRRAVVEHVAEVRLAGARAHLGPHHAVASRPRARRPGRGSTGCVKLGQPVPDSNLSVELKSGSPVATST